MKELQKINIDPKEVVRMVEKGRSKTTYVVHPGQKFWELDIEKGMITEVETSKKRFDLSRGGGVGAEVSDWTARPGCLYCVAINHKVADRKFLKMVEKILQIHTLLNLK